MQWNCCNITLSIFSRCFINLSFPLHWHECVVCKVYVAIMVASRWVFETSIHYSLHLSHSAQQFQISDKLCFNICWLFSWTCLPTNAIRDTNCVTPTAFSPCEHFVPHLAPNTHTHSHVQFQITFRVFIKLCATHPMFISSNESLCYHHQKIGSVFNNLWKYATTFGSNTKKCPQPKLIDRFSNFPTIILLFKNAAFCGPSDFVKIFSKYFVLVCSFQQSFNRSKYFCSEQMGK